MKYQRSSSVVAKTVAGERLLVPVAGEVADLRMLFSLNATAQAVWDALERPASIESLADMLVERFQVDRPCAMDDLRDLLGKLAAQGLVSPVSPA
jgi:hypothetical protein